MQRSRLQFTAERYEATMKIHIDSRDASSAGWRISMESESDNEVCFDYCNLNP